MFTAAAAQAWPKVSKRSSPSNAAPFPLFPSTSNAARLPKQLTPAGELLTKKYSPLNQSVIAVDDTGVGGGADRCSIDTDEMDALVGKASQASAPIAALCSSNPGLIASTAAA